MRRPLLLATLALVLPGLTGATDVVDGIAAQVGSEIVLVSDVTQYTDPVEKQIREAGASDDDVQRMKGEVLERLIERKLIDQVVKKAELEATEAEIDQTIAAIAKENQISIERLQQTVEESGMPMAVYREKIRGEIQHAKVMNGMVRSRVHVEEDEIRKLYNQRFANAPEGGDEYHLRHILLPFVGTKTDQKASVCDKAKQALARIQGGESFESVASRISAVNPERGGDVGWVHERSLKDWMIPIVKSLGAGQSSSVVESAYGCNLIQVVEKRGFQKRTYEQVRDQLREEIFRERMDVEYQRWMDKLRAQAYIERKGSFATAQRSPSMPPVSGGPSGAAPVTK
ncbi:MAG: SurA N-terminal domain-containing protein [Deltaproteobacteria bacterium]|nr:SurA N-terminal domain-containing protein [Deltaproteobacteria bacterium]